MSREPSPSVDALFAELLKAGESTGGVREFLEQQAPDETLLLALLRRAVPVRFLECVGTQAPWSERPRLLGGVALNPRTPRNLALRLLTSLFWRDLVEVAASPRVPITVRARAEGLLKEKLPQMRLGEKIALGKVAPRAVLVLLLFDPDPKVSEACLINSHLREEDLLSVLRQDTVPRSLLEAVASFIRWTERYAVRLALVLQPRTPLPLALAQISSLVKRDLLRVVMTPGLSPLVQAAARRVAEEPPGS